MSSNGKSDVSAHTDARAQVGRKSVFFVGEVEDQDQQARSKENEERLPSAPSGSPMGEGEVG